MPRQYPAVFRQELVDRMLAGESVLSLVTEYGVPEQTLRRWKSQAWVDAGLKGGVTSMESQALCDAHRRIKELEEELALVKAASKIFDPRCLVNPKGGKPSRWNSPLGYSTRQATRVAGVARGAFAYRTRLRPPTDRAIRRLLV